MKKLLMVSLVAILPLASFANDCLSFHKMMAKVALNTTHTLYTSAYNASNAVKEFREIEEGIIPTVIKKNYFQHNLNEENKEKRYIYASAKNLVLEEIKEHAHCFSKEDYDDILGK